MDVEIETMICENCKEEVCYVDWVSGEPWCSTCSLLCAVTCDNCSELIAANSCYEITVGKDTRYVSPECLIAWSLFERLPLTAERKTL